MSEPRHVPGSSPLTPDQQEQMLERYGERYRVVQDGSRGLANRKQRRAGSRKKGRKS